MTVLGLTFGLPTGTPSPTPGDTAHSHGLNFPRELKYSVASAIVNSSGVYICKSVVNDLRHGNYICKS